MANRIRQKTEKNYYRYYWLHIIPLMRLSICLFPKTAALIEIIFWAKIPIGLQQVIVIAVTASYSNYSKPFWENGFMFGFNWVKIFDSPNFFDLFDYQ